MRLHLLISSTPLLLAAACGSNKTTAASGSGGHGGSHASSTGAAGHAGGASTSTSSGSGGAAPSCGSDAWATYGHDGHRTSASDGCINGPLTLLWSYAPAAPTGKMVNQVFQALATKDAAFFHWSATDPPYTGTSAADRVTLDGKRAWTFDSGSDSELGDWGSIWNDKLALDSDGVYLLDLIDGHKVATTGVDWWGQSIPTSAALLIADTSKADGPGLFVAALDAAAKVLWKQNDQGTACTAGFTDQTGGLALDGTTLFYAPHYATGTAMQPVFASGVYAFDTSQMGKPLWNVPATPASAISAGGGRVYLVEGAPGMTKLTARKQTDGSIAWSIDVPGAGVQAPVLAGGRVLVAGAGGVMSVGQADGKAVWTKPVPATTGGHPTPISFGCGGTLPMVNLIDTSLAAALGSNTLVVAQGQDLTVMSLATGETKWTGKQSVMGSLGSPIIVGDRVYVVEHNGPSGHLLALQGAAAP